MASTKINSRPFTLSTARMLQSLIFSLLIVLFLSINPLLALDSLSYKIGQMVMVGFVPDTDFEDTLYYDIEHRNLGGVLFRDYNLESPSQISNLTSSLQNSANISLIIATDQEGGVSAQLNETNGYSATDNALTLGNLNSETTTRAQSALMANWLVQAGINTNLAPVADVNVNPTSPAIGLRGRSFSADPLVVSKHIYWFYDEMKNKSLITSLKHFPGHGSAVGDSHDGFTDVSDTWSEQELIPYSSMIDTGYIGMIQTAHLYNSHLDSLYPATLSKPTITGILRDSLGFNGVIMTDEMLMGAISNNYSFTESITKAIDAGADLLLYCENEKNGKSVLKQINQVIHAAIDSGLITESRIDESFDRIMKLKSRINTELTGTQTILAETYSLQACPNPFNPRTKISFKIDEDIYETVQMSIYTITGQLVQKNNIQTNGSGDYSVFWDGYDLSGQKVATGTYIYSLNIGNKVISGKMTLLK